MSLEWDQPPGKLSLPKKEVHIWRTPLKRDEDEVDDLETLLSEREASRADRYLFSKQRRSYVVVRGILRKISGLYTNESAELIEFEYNSFGKPFLSEVNLHFCTAQSDDYALLAFVCANKVGAEIRKWDKEINIGEVIQDSFSAKERIQYKKLPTEMHYQAFYKGLVSKEAFIKALGRGQHLEMPDFDVDLDPREPMQLLAIKGETQSVKKWTLHDVSSSDNCYAAIACEKDFKLKLFQFD